MIDEQMQASFDPESKLWRQPFYSFQRHTDVGTETLSLHGAGNPVNANTSLVRSAFRPSDDATILQFHIPSNAFISVELGHLAKVLQIAESKGIVGLELNSVF